MSLKWFCSFLENRWQAVTIGTGQSVKAPCQQGVPQGSVLGPFLFSLYLRDLPTVISSNEVKLGLFADDICIYCSGDDLNHAVSVLELSLEEIVTWLSHKSLKVNCTKSEVTFVWSQRVPAPKIAVRCDGEDLKPVSQVKYLGLVIDECLTFSAHVHAVHQDISAKLANFYRGRSCIPLQARELFYTGFIQSKLEYACTAYVHCLSMPLYNKLIGLSKKAVRIYFAVLGPLITRSRCLRT